MKANRINLLIPTYKRAQSGMLPRCAQSFVKHVSDIRNVVFTFLVNNQDNETAEYLATTEDIPCAFEVILATYSKPHLGWFYNTLYEKTKWQDEETLVTLIGDDMVCKTQNWDVEILAVMNAMEGMGIVHCRDGIQNGQIGVNLFTTRKWVRATGGVFMEDFPVDMIDVVYTEVARRLRREIYLDHVYIDHVHSSLKPKAEWDEGFTNLRNLSSLYGPDLTERVEKCIQRQIDCVLQNLK